MGNKISDIEEHFKSHYAFLCMASYNIVKNQEAAKDIVQDFFVWYCQKHSCITLRNSFKSYAVRAVKNLSLQYLEKKERKMKMVKTLDVPTYHLPTFFEKNNKKTKELQELLNKLPKTRRQIFTSYVIGGMSYAEIAENHNISINTVKTQMKRTYAFFRAHLMDKSFFILSLFLNS